MLWVITQLWYGAADLLSKRYATPISTFLAFPALGWVHWCTPCGFDVASIAVQNCLLCFGYCWLLGFLLSGFYFNFLALKEYFTTCLSHSRQTCWYLHLLCRAHFHIEECHSKVISQPKDCAMSIIYVGSNRLWVFRLPRDTGKLLRRSEKRWRCHRAEGIDMKKA